MTSHAAEVVDLARLIPDKPYELIESAKNGLIAAVAIERASAYVARHLDEREAIVEVWSHQGLDIWNYLRDIWAALATAFDPVASTSAASELQVTRIALATAFAKLERNLVAGSGRHQSLASDHEPAIRQVIFNVTTFARIEDPGYVGLQAVLAQLLCNMVSPIDPSSSVGDSGFMATYLSGARADDIIIRLLDSTESRVNIPVLHLLANVTRDSPRRQQQLLCPTGMTWLSRVLSRTEEWHDASDGRFDLAYTIFTNYFDSGTQGQLFSLLDHPPEPVTPAQTTLLKFLDSYLVSSTRTDAVPSPNTFLIDTFSPLSEYSSSSLKSSRDDPRLPKAIEALTLVCECLSGMGLASQERRDKGKGKAVEGGDEEVVQVMRDVEGGIVEALIELLRELDTFVPRVKPGAPVDRAKQEALAPMAAMKRNLVRLLGVLTFDNVPVGDLVRNCGGVQLLLSMTEVDEFNPYLREHALFVVRNLMKDNPANQSVIAEMDPVGVVSEDGELLPLPERLRRQRQGREAPSSQTVQAPNGNGAAAGEPG